MKAEEQIPGAEFKALKAEALEGAKALEASRPISMMHIDDMVEIICRARYPVEKNFT